MSVGHGTSADRTRQESYRQAAAAAVAELDEIDAVVMSLEARLVTLRTRARSLTALLDVIQEVAPDAATRPEPFSPRAAESGSSLPRRPRERERTPDLLDLPVRVGSAPGPSLDPDDLLPARPAPRPAASVPGGHDPLDRRVPLGDREPLDRRDPLDRRFPLADPLDRRDPLDRDLPAHR